MLEPAISSRVSATSMAGEHLVLIRDRDALPWSEWGTDRAAHAFRSEVNVHLPVEVAGKAVLDQPRSESASARHLEVGPPLSFHKRSRRAWPSWQSCTQVISTVPV